RVGIRMVHSGQVVSLDHSRKLNIVVDDVADLLRPPRLRYCWARYRLGTLWNFREISTDPFLGLIIVEVARNAQYGVVRNIERLVEVEELRKLGGVQMLHRTDWGPLIRVFLIGTTKHFQQDGSVRLVFIALAALFFHYLALCTYPDRIDLGMQHTFALHIECRLQVVGRNHFVIVSLVRRGERIERSADRLDFLHV